MPELIVFDNNTYLKKEVDSYHCTGCFFQKDKKKAGSCNVGPWKSNCVKYAKMNSRLDTDYYIFIKIPSLNKLKVL